MLLKSNSEQVEAKSNSEQVEVKSNSETLSKNREVPPESSIEVHQESSIEVHLESNIEVHLKESNTDKPPMLLQTKENPKPAKRPPNTRLEDRQFVKATNPPTTFLQLDTS